MTFMLHYSATVCCKNTVGVLLCYLLILKAARPIYILTIYSESGLALYSICYAIGPMRHSKF